MLLETLDKIPLTGLILFAFVLGLAPFFPEPHLVGKLHLLFQGQHLRSIDIFDLVWHTWPIALLVVKLIRMRQSG